MNDGGIEQKTVVDVNLKEIRRHGSSDFPVGIYRDDFSEFEHGQIAWHWHEEIQFDYVIKGRVLVQVGTSEFILGEKESIFINTGLLHRLVPIDESGKEISSPKLGECVINSYVCSWKLAESDRISRVYRECIIPLLEAKTDAMLLSKEESEMLFQMDLEYRDDKTSSAMAVKGYLCLLWSRLLLNQSSKNHMISAKEERDFERVKTAMSYMQSHFNQKVTLEEVAQVLAVSKSELCRCFKRVLKLSPMEYLIQYRLEEAGKLLQTKNQSITQIALATGFDSASHFGRFFLKSFGCTPGEYRTRK